MVFSKAAVYLFTVYVAFTHDRDRLYSVRVKQKLKSSYIVVVVVVAIVSCHCLVSTSRTLARRASTGCVGSDVHLTLSPLRR